MASHDKVRLLQSQATCFLCNEYFSNPVSILCGHSFCLDCINQEWKGSKTHYTCPKCRKRHQGAKRFWPNSNVAAMTDLAKQFLPEHGEQGCMCEEHRETHKYFCQEESVPICVVCRVSKEHVAHSCITIDEAVMEYKGKMRSQMDQLKRKKDELVHLRATMDKNIRELEKKSVDEHLRVQAEFGHQQRLLEDEKRLILSQIAKQERNLRKKMETDLAKVTSQTRHLEMLMAEIEEKNEEKGAPLLLGINAILNRCENINFEKPEPITPEIEKFICNFAPRDTIGQVLMNTVPILENLTLDPGTAHPSITLSEDQKSASRSSTEQDRNEDRRRFDATACVLGTRGFTEGMHSWCVEVGISSSHWAVGVALESMNRTGPFDLIPEEGVWALEMERDHSQANTMGESNRPGCGSPTRITVFLNCEGGQVSFYHTSSRSHIHTLATRPWQEAVFPIFYLGTEDVHFKLCP